MDERIELTPAAVRQRCWPSSRGRREQGNFVGGAGEWRVRTGDDRVVYEIRDRILLVVVLAVGRRGAIHLDR